MIFIKLSSNLKPHQQRLLKRLKKEAVGPKVIEKRLTDGNRGGFDGKNVYIDPRLNVGKDQRRKTLRHELTHYLNKRKGKYTESTKPSIVGVKDTFLNEMSARNSEVPKHQRSKNPLVRGARAIDKLTGAIASTNHVYKDKYLKALTKLR